MGLQVIPYKGDPHLFLVTEKVTCQYKILVLDHFLSNTKLKPFHEQNRLSHVCHACFVHCNNPIVTVRQRRVHAIRTDFAY